MFPAACELTKKETTAQDLLSLTPGKAEEAGLPLCPDHLHQNVEEIHLF
jgi:hypothetical protein